MAERSTTPAVLESSPADRASAPRDGSGEGASEQASSRGLWSWTLLLLALLWLGGALLAPLAASRQWGVAPFLFLLYQPICHQMPERSFELWGTQAAVCHRCTGLYAGFVVGLLVMPIAAPLRRWLTQHPIRIVVFAVPLLIDVSLYTHNQPATRFATGLVAAVPLALLAQLATRQLRGSSAMTNTKAKTKAA